MPIKLDEVIDFENMKTGFNTMPDEFFNSKYQQSRVRKEQEMASEKEDMDRKQKQEEEKQQRRADKEKIKRENQIKKSKELEKAKQDELRKKEEAERFKKVKEEKRIEVIKKREELAKKKEEDRIKKIEFDKKAKEEKIKFQERRKQILKEEAEQRAIYEKENSGDKSKMKEYNEEIKQKNKEELDKIKEQERLSKIDKIEKKKHKSDNVNKNGVLKFFSREKQMIENDFVNGENIEKIKNSFIFSNTKVLLVVSSFVLLFISVAIFIFVNIGNGNIDKNGYHANNIGILDSLLFARKYNHNGSFIIYNLRFQDKSDIEGASLNISSIDSNPDILSKVPDNFGLISTNKNSKLNKDAFLEISNLKCKNAVLAYYDDTLISWEKIYDIDCSNDFDKKINITSSLHKYYIIYEDQPIISYGLSSSEDKSDYGYANYGYSQDDSSVNYNLIFSKFFIAKNGVAMSSDVDGDYLTDKESLIYGTDKSNFDTDGDSYLDGEEVINLYDPLSPTFGKRLWDTGRVSNYTDGTISLYYPTKFRIKNDNNRTTIITSDDNQYFYFDYVDDKYGYGLENLMSIDGIKSYAPLSDFMSPKFTNQAFIDVDGNSLYIKMNNNKIFKMSYFIDGKVKDYMATFDMVIRSINILE